MRALLDTHVVLWHLEGSRGLSRQSQQTIRQASEVIFSVVSFAEIGVKASIGKLTVPPNLREHIVRTGVKVLSLDAEHGLAVASLPMHHRDPFDRLLVAQARSEHLTIITADPRIALYDVSVVKAN
ncbi:MAG: type II toxin-antitoxin system VapC family toxin [Ornithinimicrobium sp.]